MEIFLKKLLHFRFGYAIINKLFGARQYAPLAQLDRASGYGPEGRGFEALTAYQKSSKSYDFEDFLLFISSVFRVLLFSDPNADPNGSG